MGNARIRRRVFQVGHACVPHLKHTPAYPCIAHQVLRTRSSFSVRPKPRQPCRYLAGTPHVQLQPPLRT